MATNCPPPEWPRDGYGRRASGEGVAPRPFRAELFAGRSQEPASGKAARELPGDRKERVTGKGRPRRSRPCRQEQSVSPRREEKLRLPGTSINLPGQVVREPPPICVHRDRKSYGLAFSRGRHRLRDCPCSWRRRPPGHWIPFGARGGSSHRILCEPQCQPASLQCLLRYDLFGGSLQILSFPPPERPRPSTWRARLAASPSRPPREPRRRPRRAPTPAAPNRDAALARAQAALDAGAY